MSAVRLYSAARSSAAFRVRIALRLKGIDYEYVGVDLLAGEQRGPAYRAVNPSCLVPTLDIDGLRLTQSLAILDYLEETRPAPPLLPPDPAARARARAAALAVACDIHPVNNLRVLNHLKHRLKLEPAARGDWYRHWCEQGLGQLEALVRAGGGHGDFIEGDSPTVADICLVPQIFNARRFEAQLDHVPLLIAVFERCMTLPAFAESQWDRQPDFR
ncbi:maleylacetoacetate isomerase [Derxia lacustris]|uniref:maleylacetoacetate isomerase n=1 Tax=Derxia lacustris TaxID=764842 RepID=UPI000A173C28|nr:maleylacetoacetate isomerase [Derxia lacustris]